MDQFRLDDLEKRVGHLEEGNGWHESAKYVLEQLKTLTDAIKENRIETCGVIEKLRDDNAKAHKALHEKMDAQKIICANRPIECQKVFTPSKTFYYLLLVLFVLFTTSFGLTATALKQNVDDRVSFTEYKTQHEAQCNNVKDRIINVEEQLQKYRDNTQPITSDTN